MTFTVALHGDFATGEMLKRDMGDLADVVDLFFDAGRWNWKAIASLEMQLCDHEELVLIGYSRGGSIIAEVSDVFRDKIKAAVLYESPIIDSETACGSFPALMIWNNEGARFSWNQNRRRQAEKSIEMWSRGRKVELLEGRGRHIKTNPVGHDWDCGVNHRVREWLSQAGCKHLSHVRGPTS